MGEVGSLDCIAMMAAIVICILLLQKPHKSAKTKDFKFCLNYHLDVWKQGQIVELLIEGRRI